MTRSPVNLAFPVTLSSPSTLGIFCPTYLNCRCFILIPSKNYPLNLPRHAPFGNTVRCRLSKRFSVKKYGEKFFATSLPNFLSPIFLGGGSAHTELQPKGSALKKGGHPILNALIARENIITKSKKDTKLNQIVEFFVYFVYFVVDKY